MGTIQVIQRLTKPVMDINVPKCPNGLMFACESNILTTIKE